MEKTYVDQVIETIKKCQAKLKEVKNEIQKIIGSDSNQDTKNDNYVKLQPTNFDNYITGLDVEISELISLNGRDHLWENFNNQYKEYYSARLEKIRIKAEQVNNYSLTSINSNNNWEKPLLDLLTNIGKAISRGSKYVLFENFKFGNKNYVLFGKNGAGKTTLLRELSTTLLNTNAVVIPATRNILYNVDVYHHQSEISLSNALGSNDNGKSLFFLAKLLLKEEVNQFRNSFDKNNILTNVAISIFNKLGIERTLVIDDDANLQLFKDDEQNKYSLADGSDGERSVIYILLAVLLSPQNSYVFIDEPENHLNGSLMRKLFDTLEIYRSDIKFIFATHNIQFIESRKNTELIYLEKSSMINDWIFKKFENYKDLPLDIVLNIEGTNDNVIFCEGEDRNSDDCKLYEILYPEYEIMPANGCDNVIKQTEMLNKFSYIFKKEGLGIIDYDFRDEDNIESLKSKKITVLNVNEVENLFITESCLIALKDFIRSEKSVETIRNEIIAKISKKQEGIKKDYAAKLLRRLHKKNKFEDMNNISDQLDSINSKNKEDFLSDYNSFEERLCFAVNQKQYEILLKIVPAKMILNDVALIFDLKNDVAYKKKLLLCMSSNIQLQEQIKEMIKLNS